MRFKYHIFFLITAIYLAVPSVVAAQESIQVITRGDILPKENFLKILDGQFSIAPYYSDEMGVGTAFAFASKANFSIVGSISTEGYALLGITGAHYLEEQKWRLSYKAGYSFIPTFYWGAGYVDASYNGNKSDYDKKRFNAGVEFFRIFTRHFQAGPVLGYEWIKWSNLQQDGEITDKAFNYGAAAVYDSRDRETNPTAGIYSTVKQLNYTDFKGKPHFGTTFIFDIYKNVWEGGILAFDFCSEFTYGQVPYTMLPTIGGSYRMRGYYTGRYRDNNAVSGQLELRQHIWEIIRGAVWVGAGNVWGKYCKFDIRHSLPNCGLGIRLDTGGNTSLRFDYGFGKDGQNGFIFGLNEAF